MQLPSICSCAGIERLPWLVNKRVAMLRAFSDGFRKFSELSFTSLGSARFKWHSFAQFLSWSSLLWLSITWRQRFFTQKYFLSTTSLACSSALNLLFCSVKSSLYGEKKKTLPLVENLVENFFLCSDYIKALQFVKITYTLFFEKLFLSHIHKRNWKLCI